MTDQEAFDKMVNHLATLRDRSTTSGGLCVYNGSKCAVGALFTDYEQDKFGDTDGDVRDLFEIMHEVGHDTPLFNLDRDMLMGMQSLHDDEYNWDEDGFNGWLDVKSIASRLNLIFNDPRKVQNDG